MASNTHVSSPTMLQYYSSKTKQKFGLGPFTRLRGASPPPRYADIGYEFDEQKYIDRTQARLQAGGLGTELPHGWPQALEGPLVWTGSDFEDDSELVYCLSGTDKAEIRAALLHFRGLGLEGEHVNPETFPLPVLSKKLSQIRSDVYKGRGFATIRGLDVDALGSVDLMIAYLGLTSYVAEKRGKQNRNGGMLVNVRNASKAKAHYNATTEMSYHTDLVCDVLSLLTRSCSASGGTGKIASAWTVYNELASTRPDLIHVLSKPDWPYDTFGRDPPYYQRAVLYHHDNKIIVNFSRRCLVGRGSIEPRTPGIPGLTEAQAEALDALHAISRRHELTQTLQKGDIRLVNNMGIMHRRATYEDSETNQRHLLRMWLHNSEECWKLPADLQLAWDRVFGDEEREQRWAIDELDSNGKFVTSYMWQNVDDRNTKGYGEVSRPEPGPQPGPKPKPNPPPPGPEPEVECD
ncbi:unnamed protein product [Discula destructiva]